MKIDTPISDTAPATCDRCGGVLVVFEEHPDGVIYCACACVTEGRATPESRPPGAIDTAIAPPVKGAHRCVSCGAQLAAAATDCPCQRPTVPGPDRRATVRDEQGNSRYVDRRRPEAGPSSPATVSGEAATTAKPPSAIYLSRATPDETGASRFVMAGAVVLVVAAAVGGFLARGGGRESVPGGSPSGTADPDDTLAAGNWAPASLQSGVEILKDEAGALTLVAGYVPSEVFRGFCRHPQFHGALVPGNIQPTTPPDPDLLLGSAMLMDGTGSLRQVILKRDPATTRWSIGDGKHAIELGIQSAAPASSVAVAN